MGSNPWGDVGMIKADGLLHGEACAKGSSYSKVDSDTIKIGDNADDGYQYATWVSIDSNSGIRYTHYGYAVLDDGSRPNHS